ncbi:nuclear transport factor 2 family protein [Olleya sp. YS]|uniref:nuclear transport factor 2 family protein n=1 Tax=Olleya sp. YS TaxID=3028318 RepID=UPI0024344CC5|nr:nuclear transport factor 2 family protein [Olleya sp. YS]WGD34582.1 nuclear transport factor 2 family protein [Olleya sp. YS]
MSPKEIVKAFYNSDLANDASVVSIFFHKDCQLHWNSSQGFTILDYKGLEGFFKGTRQSYNALRFQFSHILEDNQFVTTRHTLFGNTIEDPDNEIALAHFTSIWEVKDSKLFRCHEISQLADNNTLESNSFSEIKI